MWPIWLKLQIFFPRRTIVICLVNNNDAFNINVIDVEYKFWSFCIFYALTFYSFLHF